MWLGPDEPQSCMAVEPHYFHLPFKKGQESVNLEITNLSLTAQAYKVKCTDGDLFDFEPSMGILDPNRSEIIKFKYLGKTALTDDDEDEEGVHYVSILNTPVGEDEEDPRKAWEEAKKKDPPYAGNHSMIVQFPGWNPEPEREWSKGTDSDTESDSDDDDTSSYNTFTSASEPEYEISDAEAERIEPFSNSPYHKSEKGSKKGSKSSKKSKKSKMDSKKNKMDSKKSKMDSKKSKMDSKKESKSKVDSKKSNMGSKKSKIGSKKESKSKIDSKKSNMDSKKP